jgi:K+ transporter
MSALRKIGFYPIRGQRLKIQLHGGFQADLAARKNPQPVVGNEVPVPSLQPELPRWQEQIFAFLTRNAVRAPDYFLIPPPRVVELGTRVEL